MSSLEEHLIKSGAMTEAQLEIVRAEQGGQGGGLDTNILALGYLTEHALQRLLEQTFPQVPGTNFTLEPTPEAVALLDRERSKALGVLPQRLVGRQLHLLTLDPNVLASLTQVETLKGYDLVAVGVNEVRLRYLQERFHGIPREPRFVEIMDRLLARASEKAAAKASALDLLIGDPLAGLEPEWMAGATLMGDGAQPTAQDGDPEAIPLLEDELLIEITEEGPRAENEDEDTAARPLTEAHEKLGIEGFRAALDATSSMDDLPAVFFRFGVTSFKSVALFKVQSNMVMGWRGAGLGIASDLIRGIVVPVQSDTFLARAIEGGVFVGRTDENPVEERVAEQLGASSDDHVVTGVVKVAARPVLVACGVTAGQAPDPQIVSDFTELCAQASETVLRLIMARKGAKTSADETPSTSKKKTAKKRTTKKKNG